MSLLQEFQTNARLRVGSLAVLAILWGYGLLEYRDLLDVRRGEFKLVSAKVLRQEAQAKQGAWLKRAEDTKLALAAAEQRLWQDTSLAGGQALFQDWLKQQMALVNAQMPTVRIGDSETAVSGQSPADSSLRPLRAKLEFQGDAVTVLALLSAIEGSQRRVSVDGLVIKSLRNEITVSAMLQIRPQPSSPASGGAP